MKIRKKAESDDYNEEKSMEIDNSKQKLTVDPEFKELIRPLSLEERARLEESILKDGCRDAIIVWNGIILDGHNRYEICTERQRFFKTFPIKLENRDAVKQWIIRNQLSRRNLTSVEIAYYRGKLYSQLKKELPNAEGKNQHTIKVVACQDGTQALTTAEQIGKNEGVSPRTVKRDSEFSTAVDSIACNTGLNPLEVAKSIPKSKAKSIASLPPDKQIEAISNAEGGKRIFPRLKEKPTEPQSKRTVTLPSRIWNIIDAVDNESLANAITILAESWHLDMCPEAPLLEDDAIAAPMDETQIEDDVF